MKKTNWRVANMKVNHPRYGLSEIECTIRGDVKAPYTVPLDIANEIEAKLNGPSDLFGIKKVIFNEPATIVFWEDGTKTVVKCQEGDTFDPEKGLAMAISKKALGNKGNYYNTISKWTDKYYEERHDGTLIEAFVRMAKAFEKL